jgi:hypothetical protein
MTLDEQLGQQQHSAAQIAQAAQSLGLLMGALEAEIVAAARRAADGHPPAPEIAEIARRMTTVSAEYVDFQQMIWRHLTLLRSLVLG